MENNVLLILLLGFFFVFFYVSIANKKIEFIPYIYIYNFLILSAGNGIAVNLFST